MLDGCRQLVQDPCGIAEVHSAEVLTPDVLHEAFGHTIALWVAGGCVDGLQPNERAMRRASLAL